MPSPIHARFRLDYGRFELDVDLTLPGSGVTVLFGHSGSGKTTLLRCVAGLQHPATGYLRINDQIWQDSACSIFRPTYQRPLGYVFQDANLFPHLTVSGNLRYGLKRLGKPINAKALDDIQQLLGIGHLLERRPDRLSGGERQRVAIARALVLKPDILLMDEPLAALDSQRKQEILPYLQGLHRALSIPVLYVTHSRQEVAQLADHLVILTEGKITANGLPLETLSRIDLPMARERDASTVWQTTIIAHEPNYHLTRVSFAGGELSLPSIASPAGTVVRIQIHARDVSIALTAPSHSSILNVLPARITALAEVGQGQSVVRLEIGQQPLLAHITTKSAVLLDLQVGMPVFAQIKGTSLLGETGSDESARVTSTAE